MEGGRGAADRGDGGRGCNNLVHYIDGRGDVDGGRRPGASRRGGGGNEGRCNGTAVVVHVVAVGLGLGDGHAGGSGVGARVRRTRPAGSGACEEVGLTRGSVGVGVAAAVGRAEVGVHDPVGGDVGKHVLVEVVAPGGSDVLLAG